MLVEIPLTGFGATVNVAKPKKGQTVAVFGLGAVGLAVSTYFQALCAYELRLKLRYAVH